MYGIFSLQNICYFCVFFMELWCKVLFWFFDVFCWMLFEKHLGSKLMFGH